MNGLSLTTNDVTFTQFGQRIGVYNEEHVTPDIGNHFLYKLTDTLALYRAIERLDPGSTIASLNALTQAASADDKWVANESSLENLLDALRRLVLGAGAAPTTAGDDGGNWEVGAMPQSRVDYHSNLLALTQSSAFQSLAGNVTISPVESSLAARATARADFETFVALRTLSPFVIGPANAEGHAALDALWQSPAWSQAHQDWLADKASIQAGGAAFHFTDQYLSDRAGLLAKLVERNQRNLDPLLSPTTRYAGRNVLFLDLEQDIRVAAGALPSAAGGYDVIAFGKDTDDLAGELSGAAGNDSLYGMGGNDTLFGGEGKDYLEGNAGDDQLNGGNGNDILLGGTGTDIYRFSGNWGRDVAIDADGLGSIEVEGYGTLLGAANGKLNSRTWRGDDPRVIYTVRRATATRNDLLISFTDRRDTITIQGWSNATPAQTTTSRTSQSAAQVSSDGADLTEPSFLGIALSDAAPPSAAFEHTAVGTDAADSTLNSAVASQHLVGLGGNDSLRAMWALPPFDYYGYPLQSFHSVLDGGDGNDRLSGGAGDDWFRGDGNARYVITPEYTDAGGVFHGEVIDTMYVPDFLHGDDVIDGGPGNDLMAGDGGSDVLYGGDGDDELHGDAPGVDASSDLEAVPLAVRGDDWLDGGAGEDLLFGDAGDDMLYGGDDRDLLWGDDGQAALPLAFHGKDYLDGGASDDRLTGGGNDDTLFGGAGNDLLVGDDTEAEVAASAHGRDYLDGGDGDDDLIGGGADDVLVGGAGRDNLYGDDALGFALDTAAHGADTLDGGDGDDELYGGGGNDVLVGGAGNDSLTGGAGTDTLIGGPGADAMDGGAGDDVYRIAAGELSDGVLADIIYSTEGKDRIELDGSSLDAMFVQRAADGVVSLGWSAFEGIHLANGVNSSIDSIVAGGQTISLQRLVGERLNTAVTATSVRDGGQLFGGANADVLTATHAGNTVSGGRGDDRIVLGSGAGSVVTFAVGDGADEVTAVRRDTPLDPADPVRQNVLQLGPGFAADPLRLYRVGPQSFVLAANTSGDGIGFSAGDGSGAPIALQDYPFDVVRMDDGTTLSWQTILDRGIVAAPAATGGDDVLTLSPFGDTASGLAGNDRLMGLAGNDTLHGDDGNDWLDGGDGADQLDGGSGFNVLLGGAGDDRLSSLSSDYLDGGAGDDTYVVTVGPGYSAQIDDDEGTNTLVLAGAPVDGSALQLFSQAATLYLAVGTQGTIALGSGVDLAQLRVEGSGFAPLTLQQLAARSGGYVPTAVWGAGGAVPTTTLSGGAFTLIGSAHDDRLAGGAGNDRLEGRDGADTLVGGRGDDVLIGAFENAGDGGGNVYAFDAGDGNDYIRRYFTNATPTAPGDPIRSDLIRFGPGIGAESLTVRNLGAGSPAAELVIEYGNGDSIRFDAGAESTFAGIRFDDGSTLGFDSIAAMVNPAQPSDGTLGGTGVDDVLLGGGGDGALYGNAGDDLLDGGGGRDLLVGGSGSNRYRFTESSGNDSIKPSAGERGELQFVDATLASLSAAVDALDLVLRQPSGSFVRLFDYLGDPQIGATWSVRGADGSSVALGSLVSGSSGTQASLAVRRQQFIDAQFAQLGTTPQRYSSRMHRLVTPEAVQRIDQQMGEGATLEYRPFLSMETTEVSYTVNTSSPVYGTVTVTTPGSQSQFIPIHQLIIGGGSLYLPQDAVPVYGSAPPAPNSAGSPDYNSTVVGYMVPGTPTTQSQEQRIVGWQAGTSEWTEFVDSDTAVQSIVQGTDGDDLVTWPYDDIEGVTDYEFRGAIDAGAGNDSLLLGLGDGYSDWFYVPLELPFISSLRLGRGRGAWVDAGDGDDTVVGTDGEDFIIGGAGDDLLSGEQGGDTYYVSAADAGVDTIDDRSEEVVTRRDHDGGYFRAGAPNQDTLEFAPDVSISDLSYRWVDDDPAATGRRVLELFHAGRLFVRVAYEAPSGHRQVSGAPAGYYDQIAQRVIADFGYLGLPGVERFCFADGTLLRRDQLLGRLSVEPADTGNRAPFVATPPADQLVAEDAMFEFAVPAGTFADPDAGSALTYVATLDDGALLPGWLAWDPATLTFSGIPSNGDVGTLQVRVTATDPAGLSAGDSFALTVINTNDAPVVATAPSLPTATEDTAFAWAVPDSTFSDVDAGDSLTLAVTRADGSVLPPWLSFDAATRTLSGTPSNDDVGSLSLRVTATDAAGASASAPLTLAVANTNDAPVLAIAPAPLAATEDSSFAWTAPAGTFIDVDAGDALALSITRADGSALPSWLSFAAATHTLDGTPNNDDVGSLSLRVTATDMAGASASAPLTLAIANTNDAPLLAIPPAPLAATEDSSFAWTAPAGTFIDVDAGDALALSITRADGSALPSWLSFAAATRTLGGTPNNDDVGSLSLRVTAVDAAGASASGPLTLTVANTNDAPVLVTAPGAIAATEDSVFVWTVPAGTFTDVDTGDTLAPAVTRADGSALQSWLSFDAATRTLSGTASNDDIGSLTLRLIATDTAGASASAPLTLAIANTNDAPIVATALADQTAQTGSAFTYAVPATAFTDPDAGDTLAYSASMADGTALPAWLSFNAASRTFSGTPTTAGNFSVRVTATDAAGAAASDVFDLAVQSANLTLIGTAAADTLTGGAGDDTLSGLGGNDTLVGNAGNDSLDGGTGNDTLRGGPGDDTYWVDSASDVVTENANEGTDTVLSSVTLTLAAQIENLTLIGSNAVNGTGNALNNVLTGNGAANTLAGGAGDDTYVVGSGDSVTEAAGAGNDTVRSSLTWTLGANLENLVLTGTSAIDGTGNALANVITGNGGANTLVGGSGADTLIGGAGDDICVVDNAGDSVVENAAEGVDLAQSSVTYTLGANVENLTLTGTSAIDGTGNALDNVLSGNSAANTLSGNAGNDTLDGGAGNDTMIGGSGNDTFIVDASGDVVTELANEGIDSVRSSITLTLGSNVENLTLTGTSAISATGNALDNVLIGNSANNTLTGNAGNDMLDGGAGSDTMRGGTGNDTYMVERSADIVTENANEGTDTVLSSITLTLGSNLENLTLSGSAAINGSGNTLANVLIGNAAANTLSGNAGNDTLVGGGGADTLVGGSGADRYEFARGYGIDTVQENDATAGIEDRVQFGAGIAQSDVTFQRAGNNLEALLSGGADKLVVKDWYLGTQFRAEEFGFANGTLLSDAQVGNLVAAMAVFSAESDASALASSFTPAPEPDLRLASPVL